MGGRGGVGVGGQVPGHALAHSLDLPLHQLPMPLRPPPPAAPAAASHLRQHAQLLFCRRLVEDALLPAARPRMPPGVGVQLQHCWPAERSVGGGWEAMRLWEGCAGTREYRHE